MIRKNFVDMSDAERLAMAAAFNYVNSNGLIAEHAVTHDEYFLSGIHWRPQFLPWHRYFLRKLELALQAYDPTVMLPYWDWTQNNSRDLELSPWKEIFGGRGNTGGAFDAGWNYRRNNSVPGLSLPSLDHVVRELSAASYAEFRKIEGRNDGFLGSHVHAHAWVGGTMGGGSSPLDPLFYLHHCNLDRLWSIWQLNNPKADQYSCVASDSNAGGAPSVSVDKMMPEAKSPWENTPAFSGATPAEMLDHRALGYFTPVSGYTYQRDQALEAAWFAKFGTALVTNTAPKVVAEPALV